VRAVGLADLTIPHIQGEASAVIDKEGPRDKKGVWYGGEGGTVSWSGTGGNIPVSRESVKGKSPGELRGRDKRGSLPSTHLKKEQVATGGRSWGGGELNSLKFRRCYALV